VIDIALRGHLGAEALEIALADATARLRGGGTASLIVDCLSMTGYDPDARAVFVEWNKSSRGRVRRVAILTTNSLWRMVISVMGMASSTEMKPFTSRSDAMVWLAT
jgi:hypothetical protein